MKKKAYMAPATTVVTTQIEHVICGSAKINIAEDTQNNTGITVADENDQGEIPGEADARRVRLWDDE